MKNQDIVELDDKTLSKLTSKKAEERIAAELQIAQMGDKAVDALLVALQRGAKCYHKSRRVVVGIWSALGAIFAVYIVVGLYKGWAHGNWKMLDNWSGFAGFLGAGGMAGTITQSHKNAITKILEYDDIRITGPLLEERERSDSKMRSLLEQALIRLLPRMTASHASLLNREQLACMNRALKSKNSEFVVAVLKALEQVGDDTHLEAVEGLANMSPKNPFQSTIRESAIACLPYLRQRAENAVMAKTLLRASAPNMEPELLLRPATALPDGNANELLRPHNAEPPQPVVTSTQSTTEEVQTLQQRT